MNFTHNIHAHFLTNKNLYVKVYVSGMAIQTITFMSFGGYAFLTKYINDEIDEEEKQIIKSKKMAFMCGAIKSFLIREALLWPLHIASVIKILCVAGLAILN